MSEKDKSLKKGVVDTEDQSLDALQGKFSSSGEKITQEQLLRRIEQMASNYSVYALNKAMENAVIDNPYIRNTVLKNLRTIPYLPGRDSMENALADPRNNEKLLRSIGGSLFSTCFPMYKLIRFYEGVLTYHHYVIPRNVNPDYMNTPRFKKEEAFVNEWVKKLNPKYAFRRIVQEVMQEGKRAYYLRETYADGKRRENRLKEVDSGGRDLAGADAFSPYDAANRRCVSVFLQDLPDDYIKITGRSTDSYYTVSFDFTYFYSVPGANIDDYPPIFKKYLNQIQKFVSQDNNGELKITNVELAKRFKGARFGYDKSLGAKRSFYFWVDIPGDVCQVFSADETTPLQAPNFMGLFLMSADLQVYNLLQQQLTSVPLYSMVIGEIPIDEKDKANPLVISADSIDYFMGVINQHMPDGTNYVMSPGKNNKLVTFNEQTNANKIYTSALQDMLSTAGMAGLLSTTDKPNLSQNKTAQRTEKRFVDVLYGQFSHFVNRRLESLTEDGYLRYDWEFQIFGDIFSDEEEESRLAKSLAAGELYYLPRRLAMRDLTLQDATMLAHQVKASGIYDLLQPLVSAYQQSGRSPFETETKKEIPDSQVENDNTAKSKEAGTNIVKERFSLYQNQLLLDEAQEIVDRLKQIAEDIVDREGE